MNKSVSRVGGCLIVLLCVATGVSAEGEGSRARQLKRQQIEAARAAERGADKALLKSPSSPHVAPTAAECQAFSADWAKWRRDRVDGLLALSQDAGEPEAQLDNDRVMQRASDIVDDLQACRGHGFPPPTASWPNFMKFVDAHHNANWMRVPEGSVHPNQFGHKDDDLAYLKAARPQLTVPCLLQTPAFLKNVSSPKTYRAAMAMIEEHNRGKSVEGCPNDGTRWTTLIYRSQFLTTPDEAQTYGRFFVLVPSSSATGYDQWIQFGIWLPEDRKRYGERIDNMSVVAVARGNPFSDQRFDAMADWWRVPKDADPAAGLELKFRREVPPHETDNCVRCHKTGVNGIRPAAVYAFKGDDLVKVADKKLLDRLVPAPPPGGKAMHEAGPADVVAALAHYMNEEKNRETYVRPPKFEIHAGDTIASPVNYGPPFGPDADLDAPPRTPKVLNACTAPHGLTEASVRKVIQHMSCAQCHSGATDAPGLQLGMLNFPLATEKRTLVLGGKNPNLIRARILSGSMPLDPATQLPVDLTQRERRALYDCLSQEYFDPARKQGTFVDWLLDRPAASGPQPAAQPVAWAAAGEKAKPKASPKSKPVTASLTPPEVYKTKCMSCHTETATVRAPSLLGVFNRPLASVSTYTAYSADLLETAKLKDAAGNPLVWDEANLRAFLSDTSGFLSAKLGRPAVSTMKKRYAEAVTEEVVQYLMARQPLAPAPPAGGK